MYTVLVLVVLHLRLSVLLQQPLAARTPSGKCVTSCGCLTERLQGWTGLQKQVLQDLVVAATRLGQSSVATRHMTLLLQVMWFHLSPTERHDFAMQLASLASQCEGAPVPLVLSSGQVIPPVNLVVVPTTE